MMKWWERLASRKNEEFLQGLAHKAAEAAAEAEKDWMTARQRRREMTAYVNRYHQAIAPNHFRDNVTSMWGGRA